MKTGSPFYAQGLKYCWYIVGHLIKHWRRKTRQSLTCYNLAEAIYKIWVIVTTLYSQSSYSSCCGLAIFSSCSRHCQPHPLVGCMCHIPSWLINYDHAVHFRIFFDTLPFIPQGSHSTFKSSLYYLWLFRIINYSLIYIF